MDSDNEDYFFDDSDIEDEEEDEEYEFSDSSTPNSEVNDKSKKEEQEDEGEYFTFNKPNQAQTKPSNEEEFVYEILETDKIVKHMSDCIREVNVILQLPSTFTRVLLNHFKWDKDKLIELFYDGDEEKLFSDVNILLPFRSQITSANEPSECSSSSKVKRPAIECEICFLPVSDNEMIGVQCGHTFCDSCWNSYLTTKIIDEGSVEIISCAGHGCNSLVDDEIVMKLIKDQNVKLKYQHLITNSFVECNRLLHWCMTPNCSYVIKAQYFDAKPVACKCGKVFCFACGENCHDPVPCKWLKSWIKKCNDDSETTNWIAYNTKKCPKCDKVIEKNGGCNHMVCSNCKTSFCWQCMQTFREHDNSNCNKYIDKVRNNLDAKAKYKAALDRYLFYFKRYVNHVNSLKLENRLHLSIGMKMEEMQRYNMSWIEVQFLKKAVDVLCQCRQTLMYTYVFAFYLQKNNQFIIFEDNQNDLEKATEQLSEYLERGLSLHEFVDIKQKVQDKNNYCESRRKVLLDHVQEGFDKDLWLLRENNI